MRKLYLLPLLLCACFTPDNQEESEGSTDPGSTSFASSSGTPTTDPTSGPPETATTTPEGTSEASSSTAEDTSSTGSAGSCSDDQVCVEAAPAGWSAPGLLTLGEQGKLPPCASEEYPVEGHSGHEGATAPPAECGCTCDYPAGLECSTAEITYYAGDACGSAQQVNQAGPITCSTFFVGVDGQNSATVVALPPDDIACTPSASTSIAPLELSEPTKLCQPESLGLACGEDSTCFPRAEDNTFCIAQDGDVPCPADSSYSERTLLFENFEDGRSCTECECGSSETQCNGNLVIFAEDGCNGSEISAPLDGSCIESIPDSSNQSSYVPEEATGSCPPSGGTPAGEAEPIDPVTLCCASF